MQILCTGCGRQAAPGTLGRCPECEGILRPDYPAEAIGRLPGIQPGPGIDRYRDLFPVSTPLPFLGEGDTPLVPSRRLGKSLFMENLYFKVEGCNPTGSFKDRGACLVATLALEAGAEGVLTASSGNAAAAISAYSAAVGLKCLILLEPGAPPTKIRQCLATGARVLPVEGIFSQGPKAIVDLIIEVAKRLNFYPAFVWAPVNPYILEGIKTLSYEIVARLPGPPDVLLCPVGGGDMFTAQWRGYLELKRAGVIERLPRMVAVQSREAPPLLKAYQTGSDRVVPLPCARSSISGINVAFTGEHALAVVRESGGLVVGVSDESVFAMQRRLGIDEGIWVEPASAAPVTALADLLSQGIINRENRVVCIMSGAGFKDSTLAQSEAESVGKENPAPFDAEKIAGRAAD